MPRFVYTLFIILVGNLAVLLYVLFFIPPQSPFLILLFLGGAHLFISLLVSLIIFIFLYGRRKRMVAPNKSFRKTFRRVFLIGAIFFAVLSLRIFDIYTVVTAVLLAVFVLVVYILAEIQSRLPSRRAI